MSVGTQRAFIYRVSLVLRVCTAACAGLLILGCLTGGRTQHVSEVAAEHPPIGDIPFSDRFEYRIARWRGFAQAACSITLDDGTLDQYLVAFPEFEKRGIRATYFLITGPREEGLWQDGPHRRILLSWDHAEILADAGHEIASHGVSHTDLTRRESDVERELRKSEAAIRARIPSLPPGMTFSWPYWRSTRKLREKASGHYLGARTGTVDFERYSQLGAMQCGSGVSPRDPFHIEAIGLRSRDSIDRITAPGDRSYTEGRWFLIDLHGVDNGRLPREAIGWEPIPLERLRKLLDYLQRRGFWTAPFGEVLRYVQERTNAELSYLRLSSDTLYLSLEDGLRDRIYDQPLTVRLRVPGDWQRVAVYKENMLLEESNTYGGYLTCNLRPDGRLIRVVKK